MRRTDASGTPKTQVSDELDRVIRALYRVKREVEELETRRPILDPRDVAASKEDSDPFARIFGHQRGVYFENELARIRAAVERISKELSRLRR